MMEQQKEGGFRISEAVSKLADRLTTPEVLRKKLQQIVAQGGGSIFVSQTHSFYLLPRLPEESRLYKSIYDGVSRSEDILLTKAEARVLLMVLARDTI